MQLQLLVSRTFAPCRTAEQTWRLAAAECGAELVVVDVDSDAGRALAGRLRVSVVPALALDERLLAIGVQTPEEARDLIAAASAPIQSK